ncbi:hypothetical protein ACFQDG_09605 [Natronoarchaeum mannanilyticum]|uniref:Uncharacterized protein n=1 Tax=Natronoarchaeum mannanilyticum TaxID=926360 RepID=A0AAV3T7M2_9EURY
MLDAAPALAVPGGPEFTVLLFVFAVPLGLACWVYADAKSRDNEYAANWGITVFLTSLFYLFPGIIVIGLYREVRE